MNKLFFIFISILLSTSVSAQYKYADYIDAAKKGDSEAQHKIGVCYALGLGIDKDYSQSLFWYHKSADQGYGPALNSLGYC